jgi:hyperosmotically inducible protein
MKPLQKPLLVTAALVALLAAGCSQQSKEGDADQRNAQTATSPASSDANKLGSGIATAIDDSTITTKVKAAIVAEPALSAADIKVNTTDGVVTLSGAIDAPDKADRAKQLAQTVDGVKAVNNELVIKSPS